MLELDGNHYLRSCQLFYNFTNILAAASVTPPSLITATGILIAGILATNEALLTCFPDDQLLNGPPQTRNL